MSNTSVIELHKLTFFYPSANLPVLNIQKWQMDKGRHTFLSGASGSGKSTLLNIICGMLVPTSGSISVLETDLCKLSRAQVDAFRATNMGVVFQQFNLIPYLSVLNNLKAARYLAANDSQTAAEFYNECQAICQSLNLSLSVLEQPANLLSVGQAQRVAIARAMINKPKLLVADEPTSALDEDATLGFLDLLFEAADLNDTTILFVSHDKRLACRFEQHVKLSDINHIEVGEGT